MNNFEKIKNMSKQELAEFLYAINFDACPCCKILRTCQGSHVPICCDENGINWLDSEDGEIEKIMANADLESER